MDPWIHGSAAGAAAGAPASAATLCTYYVIIGGALRALLHLHDKVHTVAAEAAAPAAALAAALAAAPAAGPWIHKVKVKVKPRVRRRSARERQNEAVASLDQTLKQSALTDCFNLYAIQELDKMLVQIGPSASPFIIKLPA